MLKRLSRAFGVVLAAALIACLFAVPALAWEEGEYTVHDNGTVTFEDDAYPTAYKLDIVYPESLIFDGTTDETFDPELRNAFMVENPDAVATGGYDYYCWPDAESIIFFRTAEGYEDYIIDSATLEPANAGTATIASSTEVWVSLNAPATLTVVAAQLEWSYVETDEATGIVVATTPQDAERLNLEDAQLYVAPVTDADALQTAKDVVAKNLEEWEDDFSPNALVAYDIWHENDEGQIDGPNGFDSAFFGTYITIPLPSGWKASETRVFQMSENSYEDEETGELVNEIWVNDISVEPTDDGKALRFKADGNLGRFILATELNGWAQVDGAWYYYKDGEMLKDAWVQSGGAWYYLGSDGKMLVNEWVKSGGKWYYLGEGGKMVTNKTIQSDGYFYHLDANGNPITSAWVKSGGNWYYFNASGKMVVNGWVSWGGKWYFMDMNGKLVTNKFVRYNGKYYYLNGNGNPASNSWVKYGGKWYYMDGNGNPVADGWVKYGGKWYYMDRNGNPVANGWVSYRGKYYHFNSAGVWDRTV